jgi:hypothetical protein
MRGLCKECKHHFLRKFYTKVVDDDEDNVFFMHLCLIADMDIGEDETMDCNFYEKITQPFWRT